MHAKNKKLPPKKNVAEKKPNAENDTNAPPAAAAAAATTAPETTSNDSNEKQEPVADNTPDLPAPVMIEDNESVQVLMECARYAEDDEDVQTLCAIIDEDKNMVDARDEQQRTPMHHAAANGHVNIIGELLARGAKPDAANRDGNTALHYAVAGNHIDAARRLLSKGWSVNARNANGKTPLQTIADKEYKDMELLLLKHDEELDDYKVDGANIDVDKEADKLSKVAEDMNEKKEDASKKDNENDDDDDEVCPSSPDVASPTTTGAPQEADLDDVE